LSGIELARMHDHRGLIERIAVELVYRTGLSGLVARWYAGRGAIFMFHSVTPDRSAHLDLDLRTSTTFLDRLLSSLRAADIDVLSIDEVIPRLTSTNRRRFVVFTFDDGYADNLNFALPIFEKHQAPFAVYVATGIVTRQLYGWWIGLERLLLDNDRIEISPLERRWTTSSRAEKRLAYKEVCDWVSTDIEARAPLLQSTFVRYGVSIPALLEETGLTAEQVRILGRHPLVTIGGHTKSHFELAKMPETDARDDIVANRRFLERILDGPVDHFAYPFGGPDACGAREARLTAAAGFKTAVTTRHGCVFERHLDCAHFLPRVGINRPYESLGLAHLQVDGVIAAVKALRGWGAGADSIPMAARTAATRVSDRSASAADPT
jgi:peptidoglycan/xylan/chitin deacetylase (PgdA/CDA1 family)